MTIDERGISLITHKTTLNGTGIRYDYGDKI